MDLSWLGTTVEVTIDRPLRSLHPTQDDIVYLLNYGFIANTVAGDGEPIDAYVVGVDIPIESAFGWVVAVVERRDDVENKLVVAIPGSEPWTAITPTPCSIPACGRMRSSRREPRSTG